MLSKDWIENLRISIKEIEPQLDKFGWYVNQALQDSLKLDTKSLLRGNKKHKHEVSSNLRFSLRLSRVSQVEKLETLETEFKEKGR
jgi:hypothetical protein